MLSITVTSLLLGITLVAGCPYVRNFGGRFRRCTGPECDLNGALSYCSPNGKACNMGHEQVPGGCGANTICCRSICHGPRSHCVAQGAPCTPGFNEKPGKCKVGGFKCCAPIEAA